MRDIGLLEAALARPKQYAVDSPAEADVPQLAAVYAIAIARNHPFVDGNKRVAFVALELFLELHAHHLLATDAACVTEMLALAAGDRSDDDFIAWVCSHARRASRSR